MTGPSRNVLGAVLLTSSWVFFTTEMVTVRLLSADLSIAQIAVFRLLTQIVALAPLVLWVRGETLRTTRFTTHLARSVCSAFGMLLFYMAFTLLPLALATTLTFLQAMFVMVLAALLLGEKIGQRRIVAVFVGFFGVLIVMRPGVETIDPGMLVALGAAFVSSLLMILTRSLSVTESRMTIMLYSATLGLLLISIPAILTWQPLLAQHLPMLALVGIAGTTGQFLMVGAFQVAEASALAPVDYVRLIFAVGAGYYIFNEVPDGWTWAGAAVILGAVGYATYRARVVAGAATGAFVEQAPVTKTTQS
ncbi:MAG: DMT family transporter [Proteobacteria bacterium]|nr:DMT family transporter [Pseudomonadota bacterium]